MDYETILVDIRNHVGVIRLNRPKVLNAMNRQLWTEMMDALETLGQNDEVKALIITGEGRAFSTGADLIVVYHNRRRTVNEAFSSTCAQRVVKDANCSVLRLRNLLN